MLWPKPEDPAPRCAIETGTIAAPSTAEISATIVGLSILSVRFSGAGKPEVDAAVVVLLGGCGQVQVGESNLLAMSAG